MLITQRSWVQIPAGSFLPAVASRQISRKFEQEQVRNGFHKMNNTQKLIFILIALEIVLTGQLFIADLTANPATCIAGHGCFDVQSSKFGSILGFKVGTLGFAAFLIFAATFILQHYNKLPKRTFLSLSILGSLGAIYFISLQLFILKQICSTCMVIDTGMILIMLLSIFDHKKKK